MRILVANIPLPLNRFLVDLNSALEAHNDLVHDPDVFWSMQGEFDIVHLHFPEYLTFELQKAYQTELSESLVQEVEARLKWWSDHTRIVVTRHVLLPHNAQTDPKWEQLYELVYAYADGVVHFANASISEFEERYKGTSFAHGAPLHATVPHHNYTSLPNTVSREEARRTLGIPADAEVMLVFGAIRGTEERDLILDTFSDIRNPKKHLVVSRWKETLRKIRWIRLKYWVRDLTRLYYRLHPRFTFNYGFVAEEDTQLYLKACDVLFIPRLRVLNSGNITLGMTYGRVVVGPDSWDVGELLSETGNPVFNPDTPEEASRAMESGFSLARSGEVPTTNRDLALSAWSVEQCAAQYQAFYDKVAARVREKTSVASSPSD